jgi:hypothetical protein
MHRILTSFLLLLSLAGFSQQQFSFTGKVIDGDNNEPLAFVSFAVNGSKFGGYSDIDGKFHVHSSEKIEYLRISYVGYETMDYFVEVASKNLVIRMKKANIELSEVVIVPKANPAHRIIQKAVENKMFNDPEKLKTFSYTSYDKVVFTTNVDSILKMPDIPGDTSLMELKEFVGRQDFGVVENVVERKFMYPAKNTNKVIATRISGFKDPIFVFLLSQLQSNSFYKDLINILDKNYINPISFGSTNKYFFQIEDTSYSANRPDSTFVISFRPYKNRNFDGLKGVLYINTDHYAIQNVIATPAREDNAVSIKIQQMYEKADSIHWFPVQLNTDLEFKSVNINAGKRDFHIIGSGRSYLRNIRINPQLSPKDFNEVEIYVDPMASKRPEQFWEQFRQDSLTRRDLNTYSFMDSVGNAEKFDKIAKSLETLMTGKIPFRYVDFEVNKLLRYNSYEGYYAGLGLVTNDMVSRNFQLSGYWGYGFGDKVQKYGGEFRYMFNRDRQIDLKAGYRYDAVESGGVSLFGENTIAVFDRLRYFLVNRMHYNEMKYVALGFRSLKYFKWNIGLSEEYKVIPYSYGYESPVASYSNLFTHYNTASVIASCRFAYKEKFLKNARTQISLGTDYPVVFFQFAHGIDNLLDGEFNYNRYDLKIIHSVYIKYLGKSSITVNAGFIDNDVPYTDLFNAMSSFRQFTIYVPNSFATMRMNEFVSDQYVSIFYTHDFGSLLYRSKKFEPRIAIATNAGFGSLRHPEKHTLINVNTMEKGFFESGLLLNNLLKLPMYSIGLGAYYRYGAYAYDVDKYNFSWKFTLTLPL